MTSSDFFTVANTLENALIDSGFNKLEAKDFVKKDQYIQQELQIPEEGDIESNDLGFTAVIVNEKPDLGNIDSELQQKIQYDDVNKSLRVYGCLSQDEAEKLENCFCVKNQNIW